MNGYSANALAMSAFGEGIAVTAHNIANMNTPGFQPWSRVYTSDGKQGGVHMRVRAGDRLSVGPDLADFPLLQPGNDDESVFPGSLSALPESNAVDITREMIGLITDQHAFEANAACIQTRQVMDAEVLGLIVDQQV